MVLPISSDDVAARMQIALTDPEKALLDNDLIPHAVSDLRMWLGRPIELVAVTNEQHIIPAGDPNPSAHLRLTPITMVSAVRIQGVFMPQIDYTLIPTAEWFLQPWGITFPFLPPWPLDRNVQVDYVAGLDPDTSVYYDAVRGALLSRIAREFGIARAQAAANARGIRLLDVEGYRVQFASIREAGEVYAGGFYKDELQGLTRLKRRTMR